MKRAAKKLGLKNYTQLPSDNPERLENERLRKKLSAKIFMDEWKRLFGVYKNKAMSKVRKAGLGPGAAVAMKESVFLNHIFNLIEEIQHNELV